MPPYLRHTVCGTVTSLEHPSKCTGILSNSSGMHVCYKNDPTVT